MYKYTNTNTHIHKQQKQTHTHTIQCIHKPTHVHAHAHTYGMFQESALSIYTPKLFWCVTISIEKPFMFKTRLSFSFSKTLCLYGVASIMYFVLAGLRGILLMVHH